MTHRLRLLCILAISFLTSTALALGQSANSLGLSFPGGLPAGSYQSVGTAHAFLGHALSAFPDSSPGTAFANGYVFPAAQSDAQQNGNGNQSQSQSQNQGQNGNQSQGMNGNQNQNQNQNQGKQGQGKQEAPPPKPQYLTYTPKQESLEQRAKSGKAESVDFKSSPAGAQVTVDGYFVGRTPTSARIPFGKHLVSITKWGYQSWEQEIDVTAKTPVSVNPTLNKDW